MSTHAADAYLSIDSPVFTYIIHRDSHGVKCEKSMRSLKQVAEIVNLKYPS